MKNVALPKSCVFVYVYRCKIVSEKRTYIRSKSKKNQLTRFFYYLYTCTKLIFRITQVDQFLVVQILTLFLWILFP